MDKRQKSAFKYWELDDDEFMDACEEGCFDCGEEFNDDNFGKNLSRGVSLCKRCLVNE